MPEVSHALGPAVCVYCCPDVDSVIENADQSDSFSRDVPGFGAQGLKP